MGTAEHGNVLVRLIVRPSVRLRERLRQVHKANSLPGIFVNVMSIARSNMSFQQMKLGTTVIPHFRVILTGQSISDIIFMTLRGQKVNFKVKQGTCVGLGLIPLENPFMVLLWSFKVIFNVERSIPRSFVCNVD